MFYNLIVVFRILIMKFHTCQWLSCCNQILLRLKHRKSLRYLENFPLVYVRRRLLSPHLYLIGWITTSLQLSYQKFPKLNLICFELNRGDKSKGFLLTSSKRLATIRPSWEEYPAIITIEHDSWLMNHHTSKLRIITHLPTLGLKHLLYSDLPSVRIKEGQD